MVTQAEARQRRDRQIGSVMRHVTPLWLVNDEYRDQEESLLFDLVYPHSEYGWLQASYKYDAFNDVLYHMGEHSISEEEALLIQDSDPFLPGEVATAVPNHPLPRGT